MNEENYKRISEWIREKKVRLRTFTIIYMISPYITMVSYVGIMIYVFLCGDNEEMIRVVTVPLSTFLLCTAIRYLINEKRPYEAMNINPLINKNKEGQSFPSRHVLSATIIAMCGLYVNVTLGIFLLMVSICIAIIRPIAGVHYVKDVMAGMIMGIICGVMGFWLI